MNFENFEKFLKCIDDDLTKIFEHEKEYLCCKVGCSLCCKQGDYPLSETEYKYLKSGFDKSEEKTKKRMLENILKLKNANKDSYPCPFLIDEKCGLYRYRPFVCRAFGVLTLDVNGMPTFPFCTKERLNYSRIYDKENNRLSSDLVRENNFKTFPKFYNLSNKVMMNLPKAKELGITFGKSKRMIDFLYEDFLSAKPE